MTAIVINGNVPIETVSPSINIGEIMLSADKRNSKEQQIAESDRIRRIVLPSNFWGEISGNINSSRNQSLTDILREAVKKLGSERLRDMLNENPQLREVSISNFTLPELLKWSEETATSRGCITFTREQAENWFSSSITLKMLQMMWDDAGKDATTIKNLTAFVSNRFGALAAKNHGIAKAEDAIKLMSLIDSNDLSSNDGNSNNDGSIVTEIVGRLEHVIKQLNSRAADASITMDDL